MTTLRFLFILLVVLNVLAFAAIKGWLGSTAPGGEPERISNQLNPEQIRLLAGGTEEPTPPPHPEAASADESATAPGAQPPVGPAAAEPAQPAPEGAPTAPALASAAPTPETAPEPPPPPVAICVAWAELSAESADRMAARLTAAGFKYVRSRKDTPTSWWVRTPSQGNRAQAESRVRELRELGITDTFIVQEGGPSQFAVSLGLFRTEKAAQQLLAQLRAKGAHDASVEARLTTTYRIEASLPSDRIAGVEGRRSQVGGQRTACTP